MTPTTRRSLWLTFTLALLLIGPGVLAQGFVIVTGDDADDSGHCQGTRCGGLYPTLFREGLARSASGGVGILAIGVNGSNALSAFNGWNSPSNGGPGAPVVHARSTSEIAAADFNQFAMIYTASVVRQTRGGMTNTQLVALNARQPDVAFFVNELGGSLIALTQAETAGGWGFLPVPLVTVDQSFVNATPTPELQALSPGTTQGNLSHCCFHNVFTGPPGFSGLAVLATRSDTGFPVMLGGVGTILTAEICDDGIDNDEDGLIDRDDPDCQVCGDGIRDPGEQCDDGNLLDGDGCSSRCEVESPPPAALCQSPTLFTEIGICTQEVLVDAGSYDPEGDPLTFSQNPASPYGPGTTPVVLTVQDDKGVSDTCNSDVTVFDSEAPLALCNAPAAIDGDLGSASYTSTVADNCEPPLGVTVEITDAACRDDDPDGDGVRDEEDECPDSDLREILIIDECDTGVINVLFETGCTISDRIFICGDEARNHGEFVSCVAHLTNELVAADVITGREKGVIQRCAAQAPIPLPRGPVSSGLSALIGKESVACPVDVSGATLTFPDLPGIGLLSWNVTATDAAGNSVSESCTVAVENPSTTLGNLPPAADAGADQEALIGQTVTLDGSGSVDIDGSALTYQWTLTSAPAGSAAAFDDATAVAPSLVPDVAGIYVAELVVSDGQDSSIADTTTVRVRNLPPVADAGADQSVVLGTVVTFDAGASFDPDSDGLTYAWTLAVQPAGSTAVLSDTASITPSLQVDVRGVYVAQLVVNDGFLTSLIDGVTVLVPNVPPVADAGSDQDVSVFDLVQLDGSGSSDFEGDPLTYSWTMLSRPAGSSAALSSDTIEAPTFIPDVFGVYEFELVVSDGLASSAPDTVTVTTVNTPPIANAGPNQTRFLEDVVQLDGSASFDPDGDPLTYQWELLIKPIGSTAVLSDPTAVSPTFFADLRGSYAFRLTVNDGQRLSQPDTVSVAVINRAPVASAGDDTLNAGVTYPVILDGSGSFDLDRDPLAYLWTLSSRPSGSGAQLSREETALPFFTPDRAGEYTVRLVVSDGDLSDVASVTVTAVDVDSPPNADAGRGLTVLVGQGAILDGSASNDPEGQPLTFSWGFTAVPAGSALTDGDILDGGTAMPTVVPDVAGAYVLELTVNDGAGTDADTVTVTAVTVNAPPFADPGPSVAAQSGQAIVLDGSASFDPDSGPAPLSYRWNLVAAPAGSALTTADLVTPLSPSTMFTPDVLGIYVVRLVVDDGAASASANVLVHIDAAAPGLAFQRPRIGETFYAGTVPTFGLTYFDQGTGLDLSTFQLIVDGVDVTSETLVTSTFATFTPASTLPPGNYSAEASITDLAGNVKTEPRDFAISSDVFQAIADCSPTDGVVPLTVRFRTRGTFSGGTIVRYRWDFEGDGRFDTSDAVARDYTRTFDIGGTRDAVLEVTNNFGERITDVCSIRVSGTPPEVMAVATPSNGPAPLTVNFICDATDPDGVVALYEWDFEGDGIFDFSSPTSGAASHVYPGVGTFEAVCRVTDGDGLVATSGTIDTTVRVGPPGTPSVTATATPPSGDAPLAVAFDGTAVDDGVIVLWEWDFDGDGGFDFSSPTSPATSFTYGDGGVFAAALRVTDDSGLTSLDAVQIDVGVAVTLSIPDDTFRPGDGESVGVETTLSGGVPMRLFVRDSAGEVQRVLFDGFRAAGTYADTWDGTDAGGMPLLQGTYFVILEYELAGETRRVDLTNITGGTRYSPGRARFPRTFSPLDDDLLEITFTIPTDASEVTAFIGLFNVDTRFVTLLDREPFGVGTHTIFWDGTGPSGSIAQPPPGDSFLFGIFGFVLPDNAIFLEAAPDISGVSVEPNFFNPSTPDFLSPDDPVAVMTYSLDRQADVELTVTNLQTGVVVRTLVEPAVASGAGLTLAWDGRTDSGLYADKGDYRLALRAVDAAGNASIQRFALVRLFH